MILLTGAAGYIGQAFTAELRRRGHEFEPLSRSTLDYTRFEVLFSYVRSLNPRFIINAAGYTGRPDIEACEIHRGETIRANTLLPQTIARVCYLTKTPWGHVSSGCIYSGAMSSQQGEWKAERNLEHPAVRARLETEPGSFRGFSETDPANFSFHSQPCNFYSGSKALAEEALCWCDQVYLWRPRPVFDEEDHPRNLLSALLRGARENDSESSFTHRGEFVRACLDLWERRAPFGAYNIVNRGTISRRRIAEKTQRTLGSRPPLEVPNRVGDPVRDAAAVPRSDCILDNSKLIAAGIEMRPVEAAIEASLRAWQSPARAQETERFQKAVRSE